MPNLVDGYNEELEHDVHSFVDKTTQLTTAVLRRGFEMSMLSQPYYTDHRDLLSYVMIVWETLEMTRTNREV